MERQVLGPAPGNGGKVFVIYRSPFAGGCATVVRREWEGRGRYTGGYEHPSEPRSNGRGGGGHLSSAPGTKYHSWEVKATADLGYGKGLLPGFLLWGGERSKLSLSLIIRALIPPMKEGSSRDLITFQRPNTLTWRVRASTGEL